MSQVGGDLFDGGWVPFLMTFDDLYFQVVYSIRRHTMVCSNGSPRLSHVVWIDRRVCVSC